MLKKNPQKRCVVLKVLTMSPKKPNSANRSVIWASNLKAKSPFFVKVPGEKHSLQQHSVILIKGAKNKDLVGVNYSAIRGKFDLYGVLNRKSSRSLYGVKSTN